MTRFPFGHGPGKALGTVLAGTFLASAAFAQGFGGPPPDGSGRPPFGPPPGGPPPINAAMLPLSILDSGLQLSASQDAKITKIQQQFRPRRDGPPPPDARGDGGPGPRPDAQADTQIRAVLTPEQKKALSALLSKMNALGAAGIPPPVYPDLKLTADQMKKLTVLGQSARLAQKKAMMQGRPPGGFGPGQDPMRQTHEKAMAILTVTQRTKVEQFRESHRGPGPRSGPGGGGPRGGRGRRPGGGRDGGGFGPPPPGDWGPPPGGDDGPPPPGMDGPG
jgi:hypothetical protein